MERKTFLGIVGVIGIVIGSMALLFPAALLAGKGVSPEPAPVVWVREVGILILAMSAVVILARAQPDSPTMRAILWGNALLHAGLFPIELAAWNAGVITRVSGVAPNSVLHVVLAAGFVAFARRVAPRPA